MVENSKPTRRQERLASLYQEIISLFLEKEVKVEGGMFAVTKVEVGDDLKNLKICFSVWPDEKEKDVLESLGDLKKELRRHLADNVEVKFVPEIEFVLDDSEKKRLKIDELLKKAE